MAIDRDECARRLRAAREATGLTQGQAAERLGWKQGSYAQYELGRRVPSWVTLSEIAEALSLDPAILFPEFFPARAATKTRKGG
jgi:transcriptional regulator with XRE-family HTH domain